MKRRLFLDTRTDLEATICDQTQESSRRFPGLPDKRAIFCDKRALLWRSFQTQRVECSHLSCDESVFVIPHSALALLRHQRESETKH